MASSASQGRGLQQLATSLLLYTQAQAALADISRIQQSQSMVKAPLPEPSFYSAAAHTQPMQQPQVPRNITSFPAAALPDVSGALPFRAPQAASFIMNQPGPVAQGRVSLTHATYSAAQETPDTAQMSLQEMLGNIPYPATQHVYAPEARPALTPTYTNSAAQDQVQESRHEVHSAYEQAARLQQVESVTAIDPSLEGAPPPKRRQIPRPSNPEMPAFQVSGPAQNGMQDEAGYQAGPFSDFNPPEASRPGHAGSTARYPEANTMPPAEPASLQHRSHQDGVQPGQSAGSMQQFQTVHTMDHPHDHSTTEDAWADSSGDMSGELHGGHVGATGATDSSPASAPVNIRVHDGRAATSGPVHGGRHEEGASAMHAGRAKSRKAPPPAPSPPGSGMFAGRFKLRGISPSQSQVQPGVTSTKPSVPSTRTRPKPAALDTHAAAVTVPPMAANDVQEPSAAASEEEYEADQAEEMPTSPDSMLVVPGEVTLDPKPAKAALTRPNGHAKPAAPAAKQAATAEGSMAQATLPAPAPKGRKAALAVLPAHEEMQEPQHSLPDAREGASASAEAQRHDGLAGMSPQSRPLRKTVSWRANELFDEKSDLIQGASNLHEISLDLRKWLSTHGVLVPHDQGAQVRALHLKTAQADLC